MKQSYFLVIVLVVTLLIAYAIYQYMLPDYIKAGGPVVVVLIALSLMVVTLIFERNIVLNKAKGKGSLIKFLVSVKQEVLKGNVEGAIQACQKQRGSVATVLQAGLEKYQSLSSQKQNMTQKEMMEEIQTSINDAMMMETPLLEKNLIALSTIATISVLVGLFGTVLGMIRAFRALSQAGAPDAIALSLGISEALVNTASGLFGAILAIVAYNFFFTKVDNFTYTIDEASFSMIKSLTSTKK